MKDYKDKKIIYYSDSLNDEFAEAKINARVIDEKYNYNLSFGRKILRFFAYRMIAIPIAYIYLKLVWGHKIVGADRLKKEKGGVYLYGNHTNAIADALIPTMLTLPKGIFVIVNPDNVSMPVLGKLTPALGAIPLPGNMKASRNFMEALKKLAANNQNIMIYPEAHIWPYYTKIRPFKDDSFTYPIKHDKPVYCFTNAYIERKRRRPRIVTYVEGPFYGDKDIPIKDARKELRDKVYRAMCENSKHSNVEIISYVYREK